MCAWLRKPTDDASAVFVHGLMSDAEASWTHESGTYWPQLLANEEAVGALGIYVYTYQANILSGSYSLNDVVDDLKEHMNLDGVLKSKQVIFVCHSMGGIVVRKFIVERAIELRDLHIEIGLFLVASPSLGAYYANWISLLTHSLGNTQIDALRFSQDNTWLNGLDKEFMNLKDLGALIIKGQELMEDKLLVTNRKTLLSRLSTVLSSLFWRGQVVEPFSAARYFGDRYKVPGSDHRSIAKPQDDTAMQHRLLCRFIKKMVMPKDAPQNTADQSPTVTKIYTNSVGFKTERKPNEVQLIQAIQTIRDARMSNKSFRVPLDYKAEIVFLRKKLDELYSNFEALMGKHATADEWSRVNAGRRFVHDRLDTLPNVLGLAIARFAEASLPMPDVSITMLFSRFVELILTEVISELALRQFSRDALQLFEEYADSHGSIESYVAHIDGVPVEKMVSYRIKFVGDDEERIIFVPLSYGNDGLRVRREFVESTADYIPPISFITDYAFPQMLWWNFNKPDEWNFQWKCQSVFVKDRQGHYLDAFRPNT